jgi:S-adenosylmethionine-dependent methyltransferase
VVDAHGDDPWEALGDSFVDDHYRSLRGRVRTHVIDQHLRTHLEPPPFQVVDVGGGAGDQSIPLARAGYRVTIVDSSPSMLERAERRLVSEDPAVGRRVRLVEASGEDAPDGLGGQVFGGVLCHGVLMYLDDPEPLVDALCRLTAPGGLLSIVTKNVEVMAVRHVHQGDWAAALRAFDSDRQVNGLRVETRGDRIDALCNMIATRSVDPITWYGVRLFTDGWAPELPPADAEDLVLEVELMASRRDPYRRLSRLFHLLGRRPEESSASASERDCGQVR